MNQYFEKVFNRTLYSDYEMILTKFEVNMSVTYLKNGNQLNYYYIKFCHIQRKREIYVYKFFLYFFMIQLG